MGATEQYTIVVCMDDYQLGIDWFMRDFKAKMENQSRRLPCMAFTNCRVLDTSPPNPKLDILFAKPVAPDKCAAVAFNTLSTAKRNEIIKLTKDAAYSTIAALGTLTGSHAHIDLVCELDGDKMFILTSNKGAIKLKQCPVNQNTLKHLLSDDPVNSMDESFHVQRLLMQT